MLLEEADIFLTITNPAKNFQKTYDLVFGKSKIGRNSWYKYIITDDDTTIPREESLIIIIKNAEDRITVIYRFKLNVMKIIEVNFNETWTWVDCEMVINKDKPDLKKINSGMMAINEKETRLSESISGNKRQTMKFEEKELETQSKKFKDIEEEKDVGYLFCDLF